MTTNPQRFLVAWFDQEHDVVEATSEARGAGLQIADVYTPYAVHEMDAAMGLPRSRLNWVCFFAGLTGLLLAVSFQVWTSAVNWPINVGGKPFNSLPAFIPVSFEFTVLCASLITVGALLFVARLYPGKSCEVLAGVTNDKFALALRADVAGFDEQKARALCTQHGAVELKLMEVTP